MKKEESLIVELLQFYVPKLQNVPLKLTQTTETLNVWIRSFTPKSIIYFVVLVVKSVYLMISFQSLMKLWSTEKQKYNLIS